MSERISVPNHHADYPGFSGWAGVVAALSMVSGRKSDARLAVALSGATFGDAVVDIGCGPGVAARYAARLGVHVTGVDPARVMLRVARLLAESSAPVDVSSRSNAARGPARTAMPVTVGPTRKPTRSQTAAAIMASPMFRSNAIPAGTDQQ